MLFRVSQISPTVELVFANSDKFINVYPEYHQVGDLNYRNVDVAAWSIVGTEYRWSTTLPVINADTVPVIQLIYSYNATQAQRQQQYDAFKSITSVETVENTLHLYTPIQPTVGFRIRFRTLNKVDLAINLNQLYARGLAYQGNPTGLISILTSFNPVANHTQNLAANVPLGTSNAAGAMPAGFTSRLAKLEKALGDLNFQPSKNAKVTGYTDAGQTTLITKYYDEVQDVHELSDVPSEYRQVEFLKSDGTQYIDTGWSWDEGGIGTAPTVHIKCKGCIDGDYSIFGRYRLFNLTGSNGRLRFYGYTASQNIITDVATGNTMHTWELLDANLYCDDVRQNTTPDYFPALYGSGALGNIFIFARNDGGIDDNGGNCCIASFLVEEKDAYTGTVTPICDLVAVVRVSDNTPGMWDRVSHRFLTNQGSGTFVTGPEISENPWYGDCILSNRPNTNINSDCSELIKGQLAMTWDVTEFYSSSITDMSYFFADNVNLTQIIGLDLLDTSSLTDISYMFSGDLLLTRLDLSSWITQNIINVEGLFKNCSGLTEIDVRNFDFTHKPDGITALIEQADVFTGVPDNCVIWVGGETQYNAIHAVYPNLTGITYN